MRVSAWSLLFLVLAGCSSHSIEPRPAFDDPQEIPTVELVEVLPAPGGNFDIRWDYADSVFAIVDGFFVERAPWSEGAPAGDFAPLHEGLLQVRTYEDRSSLPEGSYAYRVTAQTAAGVRGIPSNILLGIVDLVPPNPPVLTAQITVIMEQQVVELSWTESDSDVVFYRVYRDPPLCDTCSPLFAEISGRTITDSLVGPERGGKSREYFYWVTAVDRGLNESAASNIQKATIEF